MTTPLILGLQFFASFILLMLTSSVAWKRRSNPGSLTSFLTMIGAFAGWTAFSAITRGMGIIGLHTAIPAGIMAMFGVFVAWAVLNFAIRFPDSILDGGHLFLLRASGAISVVIAATVWSSDYVSHRRFVDGVMIIDRGVLYYVASLWSFFLIFTGIGVLIYKRIRENRPTYKLRLNYSLFGMIPALILAFFFSFLLPALNQNFNKHTWLGPGSSVFVTILLFVAIARNGIYDIQTTLHKTLFLLFLSSLAVAMIYIPIGVYVSVAYGLDIESGLLILFGLLVSHSILAILYPRISVLILGRKRNPEDLVRMILSLAADVERDANEVCHDVAMLLKISFVTEKTLAVVPSGDQYRIILPEASDLSSDAQIRVLRGLNTNPRVTRTMASLIFNSEDADLSLQSLKAETFGARPSRAVRYALQVRDELVSMGLDIFMPVVNGPRLLAIFLLGGKSGGAPFFPSEHTTLRTISTALSIALKNVDDYTRMVKVNSALLQDTTWTESFDPIHRTVSLSDDRQIIYRGRTMEKTIEEINKAAEHDESVLILGETGSGKDLAAHLIHSASSRNTKPLIAVNCGALADSLLENELFGHERGAYTGADKSYQGLFEQANEGILFLDEIGEISENLQLKLLRVLEDRRIPRLGGKTVKVNIRIIAATNRNLKERVDKGLFRADLYYRLNVITVKLPSLRDRREDIPTLVEYFMKRYTDRFGRSRMRCTTEAMRILQQYDWPGNVRELENTLLRAIVSAEGETLETKHFPDLSSSLPTKKGESITGGLQRRAGEGLEDFLRRMENLLIQDALIKSGGNKAKAARDLGLGRTTFYHKLSLLEKPSPQKKN